MRRKADVVADDLLGKIAKGELERGAVLPNESALAARYGVNRGVVREAVKQLEVHRLLRPARRRGTEVLDPLATLSPDVLRAMLRQGDAGVDPDMLASLLEIRELVDVRMNELAARRRTRRDLAALEDRLSELEAARFVPRSYGAAVEELVLAIARATKNPLFEMLVHWHGQVYRELEDLLVLVRAPSEAHLQGVRELVRAIRARDHELARALTEAYHAWATPALMAAVGRRREEGS